MSLNADGTLVEPKDGIIVMPLRGNKNTVSFIIDGLFFTFAKVENNKVELIAKDKGLIPKQKFKKAVRKAYAILLK